MADDMIGTLFESDATSLLDGEASHLLTELESMASDSGQPQSAPAIPQQQFYDFGGGGGSMPQQQQLQSPQAIQSPAGSLHSPGGLMSPSNPQHFSSPPSQQSPALQRQMSAPSPYTQYPPHSMQQPSTPQPNSGNSANPMWRQPTYPHPSQPGGYMGQSPGHMGPGGPSTGQFMSPHHPQPPQQRHVPHGRPPHAPSPTADMYGGPSHSQQMAYNQQLPPGYMHPGMSHQQQQQQHMMAGQPRMPRPGVAQYGGHVMPHQRLPGPQPGQMRLPNQMTHPSQMMPGGDMHPQQMSYRPPHHQQYQAMSHSSRGDMMPPGHYGAMSQGPSMGSHGVGSPYGYVGQQPPPMMSPHSSQPSYMPQSSQQYHMATSSQSHHNGSSLEQLEKMVVPMGSQGPPTSRSPQQHYMSQQQAHMMTDPGMMSPRGQQMSVHHGGPPPNMSPMRPGGPPPPHMMQQQHRHMGPPGPDMHMQMQQSMYGAPHQQPPPPKSPMTPIQTINQEIEVIEHRVRQLQSVPLPHTPEHEKDLCTVEERLRSLNSQKSMMLADIEEAKQKKASEAEKAAAAATSTAATTSSSSSKDNAVSQSLYSSAGDNNRGGSSPDLPLPSIDESTMDSQTDLSLPEHDSTMDSTDSKLEATISASDLAAADSHTDDNDELGAALSAIADDKSISLTPPPISPTLPQPDPLSITVNADGQSRTKVPSNETSVGCSSSNSSGGLSSTTPVTSIAGMGSPPTAITSVDNTKLSATAGESNTGSMTDATMADAGPPLPHDVNTSQSSTAPTSSKASAKKEPKAKKSKSKKNSQQTLAMSQHTSQSSSVPPPPMYHLAGADHMSMMPTESMHPVHSAHVPSSSAAVRPMHNMIGGPVASTSGSLPPMPPHPGMPAQQIMLIPQQHTGPPHMMQGMPGHPMPPGQQPANIPLSHCPPTSAVQGQLLVAQPASAGAVPYNTAQPGQPVHMTMPVGQPIVPRGMAAHGAPQLRPIAPRPHPQAMSGGGPPILPNSVMPLQYCRFAAHGFHTHPYRPYPMYYQHPWYNRMPQMPVNGPNAPVNNHLPELLEDPADSVSDIPSTVDSPALSDVSLPTKGRKSGAKGKTPGKRGRKPGSTNKKPPASLLKLKKRKRKDSDSMSDGELSPGVANTPDSQFDSFVVHRRSGRVTKKQKYVDELDLDLSEEDEKKSGAADNDTSGIVIQQQQPQQETYEEAPVVNQFIVEKIMGKREGTREAEPEPEPEAEDAKTEPEDNIEEGEGESKPKIDGLDGAKATPSSDKVKSKVEPKTVPVTEYFVKYKNFSYLHCEWRTQEELEVHDKRVNQKIKRWLQKQTQAHSYMMNMVDEDELFNPDYAEVDRVLSESHIPAPEGSGEPESVYYLVKWRQLPYEDATWELEEDVDKAAIEQYKKYVQPPRNTQRVAAPTPDQWKGGIQAGRLYKGENQLREYQFEGVSWLTFCYYNRQNCILADEMGLGKTVQSITFLQAVYEYGIRGPFLVIAPLSTIGNWIREFDTWTDLNVIVYHGSSVSRQMLQEYEMFYKTDSGRRRFDVFKFNALITTYEVIIQDVELLAQIDWRCCVIDEAHRLKNKNCKLMEGLRCFELEHKVLLSGTPLQNNVEELFSLLHFLEPARFKSSAEFLSEFGDLKTEGQVEKLKAILKPMMLRRLKEDVEKNLAPKEETIIEVELTNIQKKYYRAILERNFSFLSKGSTTANVPNLMNTMMELRKCCNHPYLIDGAEEQIISDLKGSKSHAEDAELLIDAMVQASGKLVLLDKLLPKLKAGNHKVLIFSQMIRVLDILEDYLISRKYIYERIDGRIRGNQRQEAIDRFSKPESDRFVFLLCTRAGGLGINLTAADTCVIYDSDWNPQNDLQAQARCHRIGQQKSVKVYRLICRNTYEREMFDKASLKLGLDKAVLQSMGSNKDASNSNNAAAPLSKQEVEQLLKKGAYGALMEDDQSGDRFCEEDIDQILQRRTQIITIEAVGKGSTFAKASFSSAGARDDIDINDPEFWQKWAKKADIEVADEKNDLIIAEPRQRKQTKRYGGQEDRLEAMSDLESSSDSESEDKKGKGRGRRGKKKDDDFEFDDNAPPPGCYARPECFKVEKLLMVYGWGRWSEIVKHGRYRRSLDELDVHSIAQAILLYSVQNYKGDVTIKRFVCELIMPSDDSQGSALRNHMLNTPSSRSKKARNKAKKEGAEEDDSMDGMSQQGDTPAAVASDPVDEKLRSCAINTETVLSDAGYRKHLVKHSNKVLLRVKTLYYLKHEIVGDEACTKLSEEVGHSLITMQPVPRCEGEPPATWWDKEADKCLLLGVCKHGYEKYNVIRADSTLLFLAICGPPDRQALRKEQLDDDEEADKLDDAMNEDSPATPAAAAEGGTDSPSSKYLPFPSTSDLNTRLRRLITAFQKYKRRRQEQEAAAAERKSARLERGTVIRGGREAERVVEKKVKWTRREESDFYRVASSFGVETTRRGSGSANEPRQYVWDTFRQLANLHKKDDDMLTDYMEAFCYMCRKVCGKLTPEEEVSPPALMVDAISEERATRCLTRIDLLNKIREEILWHDQLTKRLTCCQFSPEMPPWWKPGEHDKDLLIGAAKHGLTHTDQHILYDPKLCFKDLMLKSLTEPDRPKQVAAIKPVQEQTNPNRVNLPSAKSEPEIAVKDQQSTDVKSEADEASEPKGSENPAGSDPQEDGEEKTDTVVNGEMEHDGKSAECSEPSEPQDAASAANEQHAECDENKELNKSEIDADKSESVKTEVHERKANGIQSMEEAIPFYWPKDRVLYQRLELVCYCIETGEWPTAAVSRRISQLAATSHLDTPVGTPVPSRTDTPNLSEYSCAIDDDEQLDSLKMTISRAGSRGRKPKRSRLDMEVDRIARLRDGGAESECSQSTPLRGTPDSYMNGTLAGSFTAEELLGGYAPPTRKKRGRKSKAEKEAENRAATEAAVAASYHRIVSLNIDPEVRIPMINLDDGSRLLGEDAPLRKNLQSWMIEHPGYMAEIPDTLGSSSSSSQGALAGLSSSGGSDRRGRKGRAVDTELPDLANLTGAENVPVINRETHKRIVGSKAPTLLQLSSWLDKNPHYDVDPAWGTLAKSILPEHLHNRVHSDKKKRKREADVATSSAASLAAQQAAAAQALLAASMQGYPMNMAAFNSLAAMGMPSSLLSLYGLGGLGADTSGTDDETMKALAAATASTSAHSAFPFQMYNPMLAYSSMLAASGLGMTQSTYAQAMASAGMFNGLMGFDPSMFGGTSSDMDTESAEKLALMAASMGSGMNIMEELQMRSKLLEEMYGRTASTSANGERPSSSSKEPGETSSPSTSRSHHKKAATMTKASSEAAAPASAVSAREEQPEDLSIRSKGSAVSPEPSSEGRISRTSASDSAAAAVEAVEGGHGRDGRSSSASNHVEGRVSRGSDHSPSLNRPTSPAAAKPAEGIDEETPPNEDLVANDAEEADINDATDT